MQIQMTVRRAATLDALERLLDRIDCGRSPKPDWIELQRGCDLDRLPDPHADALLARVHAGVRRGIRVSRMPEKAPSRLAMWRRLARNGLHDFTDDGFSKCYDSPFVENYDYIANYLEGGLDALDPYRVYSAVLGTHDYTIEDFVHTRLGEKIATVVEPMAGSADFSYAGHFHCPDFQYLMIDLDEKARDHVLNRSWLPNTRRHYAVGDVLDESVWQQTKSLVRGESLAYLGKQSHHFFDAKQLLRLLELGTRYVDYFILEVPQPSIVSELEHTEELTRREMEEAGFKVALVDEPDARPNPFTNSLSFRLEAWDEKGRRTLFRYAGWTSWQHPTLVAFARLLDLEVLYFHSELHEFVPVEEQVEESDVLDNVSFMLFTRRP